MGRPRVNFREAITRRANFDHMHRKQSGGQGQFGRVRAPPPPPPTLLLFCTHLSRDCGGALGSLLCESCSYPGMLLSMVYD